MYSYTTHFYFEYLLVISPTSDLSEMIMKYKYRFADDYGCAFAANLKPHMTLATFIQSSAMEERIVRWLRNQACSFNPMVVVLKGFGRFESHTIYINVTTQENLLNLVSSIKHSFAHQLAMVKSLKPYFSNNLHVTVARGMNDQQCEEAWSIFENKSFNASFDANCMLLLKRPVDIRSLKSHGRYTKVAELPFRSKNLYGMQISMFN